MSFNSFFIWVVAYGYVASDTEAEATPLASVKPTANATAKNDPQAAADPDADGIVLEVEAAPEAAPEVAPEAATQPETSRKSRRRSWV